MVVLDDDIDRLHLAALLSICNGKDSFSSVRELGSIQLRFSRTGLLLSHSSGDSLCNDCELRGNLDEYE